MTNDELAAEYIAPIHDPGTQKLYYGDERRDSHLIYHLVENELRSARWKFPWWPTDIVHAAVIVAEEAGEVLKAANEIRWRHKGTDKDELRKELIQTMAMCVRMLEESL